MRLFNHACIINKLLESETLWLSATAPRFLVTQGDLHPVKETNFPPAILLKCKQHAHSLTPNKKSKKNNYSLHPFVLNYGE